MLPDVAEDADPAMANANPAGNQVSAGQLNAVDKYDGDSDVTPFIRRITQHIAQFGWTEEQTASIVQNRLVGKAQTWLESKLLMGQTFTGDDAWSHADDGLKAALLERFGPRETVASSSKELATLSIRYPSELPRDFLDRVKVAIGRADERETPAAQRAANDHKEYLQRQVYKWFSRGIYGTPWYTKLFENSGVDPAANLPALEHQVANLQVQHEAQVKKTSASNSLSEIAASSAEEQADTLFAVGSDAPIELQIAELRQMFQRFRGGGDRRGARGRGRRGRRQGQGQAPTSEGGGKNSRTEHTCETCGGKGHYGSECASNRPYEPRGRQPANWRSEGNPASRAPATPQQRFNHRRPPPGALHEAVGGQQLDPEGFPALDYLPQESGNETGGR